MHVGEVMTPISAIVGPEHTLSQAAERMVRNGTGAALVLDGSLPGPGMITERDLLRAVADGGDPTAERVEDHMSGQIVTAMTEWPVARAAEVMVRQGVRHVVVFNGGPDPVGVLSMRDVIRVGAVSAVPVG